MPSARLGADRPPARKLSHLAAFEQAGQEHQDEAYLRREELHSSLMSEWRRLRDAGVLEGSTAGETIGRRGTEQAEIARLRRQLGSSQQRLATTETAMDVTGKAHALSESTSESAENEQPRKKR